MLSLLQKAVQQDDKSEIAAGMLHYSRHGQDPLSAKSSWSDTCNYNFKISV